MAQTTSALSPPARVIDRDGLIALALTVTGAIVLGWMMLPIFTASHFEAVSYTTSNLALGDLGSGIFAQNPRQPIVPEFIFATRSGVVVLIRALAPLLGSPDAAFRAVVVLSSLAILAALWHCARAWTPGRVPVWCCLWAAIFLPGMIELGYTLNDNVVAVAFAALAVATLARPADATPFGPGRYALAGALAGLAVAARIEGVLILPVLLAQTWTDQPGWRERMGRLAIAALTGSAVLAATAAVTGYSPLAIAGVIARFGNPAAFDPSTWISRRAIVYGIAVGLPATLLVPSVIPALRRDRGVALLWFALAYTAVLLAIAIKGATIPRYVYPISYILILPLLIYALARLRQKLILVAMAGLMLFGLDLTVMMDGPRTLLGKAYAPYYTLLWQRSVADNRARFASVIDAAEAGTGPRTFLTGFYNEEYLLKLLLRERGYHEAAPTGGPCDAVGLYRRGPDTLAVVPVDKTYAHAPGSFDLIWALSVLEASRCPAIAQDRAVEAYDLYGPQLRSFDPIQKQAESGIRNSPYKEVLIPEILDSAGLEARRQRACAIASEALGTCDPAVVERRYAAYLARYALPNPDRAR